MKKLVFIITFLVLSQVCKSTEFVTNDVLQGHGTYQNIEVYNNILYILTHKEYDKNLKASIAGLIKYDKNTETFSEIPVSYLENGQVQKIKISALSKLAINLKGDVYLISEGLFVLKNDLSWERIILDDDLDDFMSCTNICFDVYDNLWVTAYTKQQGTTSKSYIFKMNNNKEFEKLFETNSIYSFYGKSKNPIQPLKDGRVVISREWQKSAEEEEFEKYNKHELWFFNQDGSFKTYQIHTSSKFPDYQKYGLESDNDYNKNVFDIYETSNNILYISCVTNMFNMTQENGSLVLVKVGEGLSYLKDDNWKVFDEKDGLPFNSLSEESKRFNPIFNLMELNNGKIFFVSDDGFYVVNNDEKVEKLVSRNLFEQGKMIISTDYLLDEEIFNLHFDRFINGSDNYNVSTNFENLKRTTDGTIFLNYGQGILAFDEQLLNTKSVEITDESDIKIFPNPSSDFITISGLEINSRYEIIDIYGNLVFEGLNNGMINVSNLSSGCYFVKINVSNRTINFNFIKL
jgi:hypothetical protein